MAIAVDEEVKQMIMRENQDYRVCTACMGPALVPVSVKEPKVSDVQVPVGDHIIFVSRVQAPYIDRITMDMLYDEDEIDSCPAFYSHTMKKYQGQQ